MNNEKHSPIEPDTPLKDEFIGQLEVKTVTREMLYRVVLEKVYKEEIRTWEMMQKVNKESGMGPVQKNSMLQLIENVLINNPQPDTPLQDEGAMAWLKREGYPDVMPMTLDNLGIILDRYTKYLSAPPEPSSSGPLARATEYAKTRLIETDDGKCANTFDVICLCIAQFSLMPENNPEPSSKEQLTVEDYKEVIEDHKILVRELDFIINRENAAKQASLCDIVAQLKNEYNGKEQEGFAVGFAEWIMENYWIPDKDNKTWMKLIKRKWADYTTDQLYQLYLKNKTYE